MAERCAGVELLLRASQNRRVDHPEAARLWEALPQGTRAGTRAVHIGARDGKGARTAEVTLWFQTSTLQPPKQRAKEALAPVTVMTVWAIEEHPPAATEALEWRLLTTGPVGTRAQACKIVGND